MKARVIYISQMDDSLIEAMHMIPAHSIDEALKIARTLVDTKEPEITAIPDGISVVVR